MRDLHLHFACGRPGYCCCRCLPRSPRVPPFIRLCFQALPKGSLPVARFAKAPGRTMWWGGAGAEVTVAAPARDWSRSQSCAQMAVMLQEECGLMSPLVFTLVR